MTRRLGVAAALVDGVMVAGDVEVDQGTGTVVAVAIDTSAGRGVAVPGLVDLQINGYAGVDLRRAERDGYGTVCAALAVRGVTAFAPTFPDQSVDAHVASLEQLAGVHADPPSGSRILGAHLEGPNLSPVRRGAHRSEHLVAIEDRVTERLLNAGPVALMTLAPELRGALRLVAALVARGVVVSVGHSDADAATVRSAFDAGARHLTHCWNATRPPLARDPGPVGAALADQRVTNGLIADLVHVGSELVLLTLAAAAGRVAVTTDAVAPAGSPHLDDQLVDGALRLGDGTIAGGAAAPDDCLRNLVSLGVALPTAVDACGGAQRRLLGLPAVRLREGDVADLVVLDDDLQPARTYVSGHLVWSA